MSNSSAVLDQVREVTSLLRSRDPITKGERERLAEEHFRGQIARMTGTGETYGEATQSRGMAGAARSEDEFREKLRSIDNDLGEQIRIVQEGVEDYFTTGMMPAPYYAWRVAVILRKAKEFELEAEFLEAFSTHFRAGLGRRYQRIAERAPKARKLAEQS